MKNIVFSENVMSVNLLGSRGSDWMNRLVFLEGMRLFVWNAKQIIKGFSFEFINIDFLRSFWRCLLSVWSVNPLISCKLLSLSHISQYINILITWVFIIFIKSMSLLIIVLHNILRSLELKVILILRMPRSLLFKNPFKSLFQLRVRNVIVWRFEDKSKD